MPVMNFFVIFSYNVTKNASASAHVINCLELNPTCAMNLMCCLLLPQNKQHTYHAPAITFCCGVVMPQSSTLCIVTHMHAMSFNLHPSESWPYRPIPNKQSSLFHHIHLMMPHCIPEPFTYTTYEETEEWNNMRYTFSLVDKV